MRKRYFAPLLVFTVLLLAAVLLEKQERKPKLVNCIVSMDTAYLTVLTDRQSVKDEGKFYKRLEKMCREDDFREMKLQTEKRGLPQRVYVSVYVTKRELECGSPYRVVRYENLFASSPCRRHENEKHREELQSSGEHIKH